MSWICCADNTFESNRNETTLTCFLPHFLQDEHLALSMLCAESVLLFALHDVLYLVRLACMKNETFCVCYHACSITLQNLEPNTLVVKKSDSNWYRYVKWCGPHTKKIMCSLRVLHVRQYWACKVKVSFLIKKSCVSSKRDRKCSIDGVWKFVTTVSFYC